MKKLKRRGSPEKRRNLRIRKKRSSNPEKL
jgi:hypothetical protein